MTAPALAQQSPSGGSGGGIGAGAGADERGGRGRLAACRTDVATFCRNVEAGQGRKMACLKDNLAKLSPACAEIVQARAEGKAGRGERGIGRDSQRQALGAGSDSGVQPPATGGGASGTVAQAAPSGAPAPTTSGVAPNATDAPAAGSAGGASGSTAPAAPMPTGKGSRGGANGQRMAACRTDVATFCQNAEKGGGRMRCLTANQAKLSPECQSVLGELAAAANNFRQACKADSDALCAGVERGGGRLMQCLRDNQAKLSPACGEALSSMPERGARGKGRS